MAAFAVLELAWIAHFPELGAGSRFPTELVGTLAALAIVDGVHVVVDVDWPATVGPVHVMAESAGLRVVALAGMERGFDTQRAVAAVALGGINDQTTTGEAGCYLPDVRCRNTQTTHTTHAGVDRCGIGRVRVLGKVDLRQRHCRCQAVGVAHATGQHLGRGRNVHTGQGDRVVARDRSRHGTGRSGSQSHALDVLAITAPDVLDVGAGAGVVVGRSSNTILRNAEGEVHAG